MGKIYGFDTCENGEYIYDESKLIGYDPMRSSIEGRYPIPVISAFDKEIQNKTLQKKKGA